MSVLSIQDVSLVLGCGEAACHALRDVSLDLTSGSVTALVGASGSGKTSLLNLCAGFARPTAGRVDLLGRDLADLDEGGLCRLRRGKLGFVFQTFNLLAALTAGDNVELPLVLNGWSAADRRMRREELLALAGLSDKAGRYADELSAGQQQRLAVLRAIAHRPKIILMDEPTSCLDSAHAGELLDLVESLCSREQATVLLATHDLAVARRAASIVRLKDGRVVES